MQVFTLTVGLNGTKYTVSVEAKSAVEAFKLIEALVLGNRNDGQMVEGEAIE